MDEEQQLTKEQIIVYDAYLRVFSTTFGQIVLDDLRKSYFKPFSDDRLGDQPYLIRRAVEYNFVKRIERCMEIGAEHVQKMEGVAPARTPEVVPGEDFTTE